MKILNKIIQCGIHMCRDKHVRNMLPNSGGIFELKWTLINIIEAVKRK